MRLPEQAAAWPARRRSPHHPRRESHGRPAEFGLLGAGRGRPELTPAEGHILVHATLGLVVDYGRVFGDDERICPRQWVIRLMEPVLSGRAGP
ncbi:hypothetical protein ACIRRA_15990 [Nocardia sp. NPDC101769]|uniref:hypothetical protein n=1 Tax=Nocardia sp. NPDC101769 TaxID=3364333 RepID=UPI0037F75EEA